MKESFFNRLRASFSRQTQELQSSGRSFVFTVIVSFVIMVAAGIAVFFASVQGAEKVMVPEVVGKDLKTALLEMQEKELYAKIQLKYSDQAPTDTILAQDPDAGAIVKAYRRVTLTVSRGTAADQIEDYTGKNIDDVLPSVQLLSAGRSSLLKVATPVYQQDSSPRGTILAQSPEAGTVVTDAVTLQFIVSSGNQTAEVSVPNIVGKSIQQVYAAMQDSKVIFDFSSHIAYDNEKPGTITTEENPGGKVAEYSHIKAEFAFAQPSTDNPLLYGILTPADLGGAPAEYPFPVNMRLSATSREGETKTLVSFSHTGKNLSIPYAVEEGTVLTLHVLDGSAQEQTYRLQR